MITQDDVVKAIEDVVDPETGITISEMNLIDDVIIGEDGHVKVKLHMTTPLCPAQYAYSIALDVKDRVSSMPDVKKVTVVVRKHYLSPEINKAVNGPDWVPESPDEAGPGEEEEEGQEQGEGEGEGQEQGQEGEEQRKEKRDNGERGGSAA